MEDRGKGVFPHRDGVLLNTGRNALEYILSSIGHVRRVFLPYYTCDVVLEPLLKLSIPWTFYSINLNLELADNIELGVDDYLIVNNYFGIKDEYIRQLASIYKDKLIVDCAQAFFSEPIPNIKTFYSCRKFVGVADGGVAYPKHNIEIIRFFEDNTSSHDSHLIIRKKYGAEAGYKDFLNNENKLKNQPICSMSKKTKEILGHIDYSSVVNRRQTNWQYLHEHLKSQNLLSLPSRLSDECPLVYPYLIHNGSALRKKLIKQRVYIAQYWHSVYNIVKKNTVEFLLVTNLVAIPCDQRYGTKEMDEIISIINA